MTDELKKKMEELAEKKRIQISKALGHDFGNLCNNIYLSGAVDMYDLMQSQLKEACETRDYWRDIDIKNRKLEKANRVMREALTDISKGCPTGANGCSCLMDRAHIKLSEADKIIGGE